VHGFFEVGGNGVLRTLLLERIKGNVALLPLTCRQVKVDKPIISRLVLIPPLPTRCVKTSFAKSPWGSMRVTGDLCLRRERKSCARKKLLPDPDVPIICQWVLAWERRMFKGSLSIGNGPNVPRVSFGAVIPVKYV
jgi:hypothetical protein